MFSTAVDAEYRRAALAAMSDPAEELDVLVIGGGITGAGTALDAASRGLRTGLVEAGDWAGGTSGASSGLVHGGLRYLYDLDFALVAEALGERHRLLTTIAPHLVRRQPFLWPLRRRVVERAYSAMGVGLYDALAFIRSGGRGLPMQRHLSHTGVTRTFPGIRRDSLVGAIRFYDARVEDARLVLALMRTAVGHGALAASRAEVDDFLRDEAGRVVGAVVVDRETGTRHEVRARQVISATGVWTGTVQGRAQTDRGLRVLASKGIHIVVPRDRIEGETGIFVRTERSVLFVIPGDGHWVIGTTDTEWREDLDHPVATAADVDYVLEQANAVLAQRLTHDDVVATFAGLRPLLVPAKEMHGESTKISREHTVTQATPGLTVVAGGKLTTYRVMAKDAVDVSVDRARPSRTADLPLVGATGFATLAAQRTRIARRRGWDVDRVDALLGRYGGELAGLLELIDAEPGLGEPLAAAPRYLRAEVVHAVTHEGALHLEDVLVRRIRLDREQRDRGARAAEEIAAIMAPLLGWAPEQAEDEVAGYRRRVEELAEAQTRRTDAEAVAAVTDTAGHSRA